jgi:hypothetical protein
VIRLVVALAPEAKPLIARYKLAAVEPADGFRVYRGGDRWLVISGSGRESAAAATRTLQALGGGGRDRAWINVGVGGHATYPLGKAVLAHKIVDQASGQTFYPPLVIRRPCETAEVRTVARPEAAYAEPAVYDMEASGFYGEAVRYSTAELVQSLKVVSDNRERPWRGLKAALVEDLIRARLDEIDAVVEETARLAREISRGEVEPAEYSRLVGRWHFTVSEKRRLRELLRRWQVLSEGRELRLDDLQRARDAGQVLGRLERRLRELPVRVGGTPGD